MENEYLQERLKNVEKQLDVLNQTLDKYKVNTNQNINLKYSTNYKFNFTEPFRDKK